MKRFSYALRACVELAQHGEEAFDCDIEDIGVTVVTRFDLTPGAHNPRKLLWGESGWLLVLMHNHNIGCQSCRNEYRTR